MRLAVSECAPVVVSNPYLIGKNGRAQHVVREPRGGGWPREDPLGCLADSTANLSTRPSRIRGEVSTGSETCPMAIIIAGPNLLVKRLSQTAKSGSAKYLISLRLDCDKRGLWL